MITDITLVIVTISGLYLLYILFKISRLATRYVLNYFDLKKSDVLVKITLKDGTYKEIYVDKDTAEAIIRTAEENPA